MPDFQILKKKKSYLKKKKVQIMPLSHFCVTELPGILGFGKIKENRGSSAPRLVINQIEAVGEPDGSRKRFPSLGWDGSRSAPQSHYIFAALQSHSALSSLGLAFPIALYLLPDHLVSVSLLLFLLSFSTAFRGRSFKYCEVSTKSA